MTAREYRRKKGLTLADFAAAVPCSVPYLSQIETGIRRPSPEIAKRIEKASGGKVKAMALLYPPEPEPAVTGA